MECAPKKRASVIRLIWIPTLNFTGNPNADAAS
jgi:hypothetical protein